MWRALPYPSFGTVPVHLALGVFAGFLGIAYNRALLGTLAAADKLRRWPVELRAAVVGATVGILAWFHPGLVGGGDRIMQSTLSGTEVAKWILVVFFVRFGLGGSILRGINTRWVVCTYACLGCAARFSLRDGLHLLVPSCGSESNLTRHCRYGRILHRRRTSSDYRYCPGHRNDVELYHAFADAIGVFRCLWLFPL